MPIPKPSKNETEKDFLARCIPIVKDSHPDMKQNQAVAICFSEFGKFKKKTKLKETLEKTKKEIFEKPIWEQEIFWIEKGLTDEEARKLTIKKIKYDHRGFHYDPKTGKVVYT